MTAKSPTDAERLHTRLQTLSLRQLRFFAALAETRSFSRAAAHMAVSQPALSAGIRQIETLTALRLFDRTTHRVALTEVGRALLPHVQRLLVTADHALADMADAAGRGVTVRLGAIPSAIPIVARHLAAGRQADDGERDVHVCDGKSDGLVEQLRRGALDLAVCAPPALDAAMTGVPLMNDALLLVASAAHPFAARASIDWSELQGEPLVHFSGGSIGDVARAAMRQNGLAASPRYRVDQVDSLFGLVRAGLALGIMPRLYTMGLSWRGVALVPLAQPRVIRRIMLVSRRALAVEHPAAARFGSALASSLALELGHQVEDARPRPHSPGAAALGGQCG